MVDISNEAIARRHITTASAKTPKHKALKPQKTVSTDKRIHNNLGENIYTSHQTQNKVTSLSLTPKASKLEN